MKVEELSKQPSDIRSTNKVSPSYQTFFLALVEGPIGQYEAVLADPSNPNQVPPPLPAPQAQPTPGQMFASMLLLGLSCTPHLKQQLLRSLRSTNEDFAVFEPFMAAAFDHWDNGVCYKLRLMTGYPDCFQAIYALCCSGPSHTSPIHGDSICALRSAKSTS